MRFFERDFILFLLHTILKIVVDLLKLLAGFVEMTSIQQLNAHFSFSITMKQFLINIHIVGCLAFGKVKHFNAELQRHRHSSVQFDNLFVLVSILNKFVRITGDYSNL
jgi:hypothetical protein